MSSRRAEIDTLLQQMQQSPRQDYALQENRELVLALSSMDRYIDWLAHRLPRLRQEELLEINEVLPQWDEPIHRELLAIERHKWPNLILPLVHEIIATIARAGRPMVLMDLGAGGMEIERRVGEALLHARYRWPMTLVGIDSSPQTCDFAEANLLSTLRGRADVIRCDLAGLRSLLRQPPSGLRILICAADARAISELPEHCADVIFHSFMKHHVAPADQPTLDREALRCAPIVLEYDSVRHWTNLAMVSLLNWGSPAFLAAAVFSHVRSQTREQLRRLHRNIRFYRNGCYLAKKTSDA